MENFRLQLVFVRVGVHCNTTFTINSQLYSLWIFKAEEKKIFTLNRIVQFGFKPQPNASFLLAVVETCITLFNYKHSHHYIWYRNKSNSTYSYRAVPMSPWPQIKWSVFSGLPLLNHSATLAGIKGSAVSSCHQKSCPAQGHLSTGLNCLTQQDGQKLRCITST